MRLVPQTLVLLDGNQHLLGSHEELLAKGFDVNEILKAYTASKDNEGELKVKKKKTVKEIEDEAAEVKEERGRNIEKLEKVTKYFEKKRKNAAPLFEEIEAEADKKKVAELITPEEK